MSTNPPDRRTLLLAGGAGLALSTSPRWISDTFARQGGRTREPVGDPVSRALERAKAIGKPLFVVVVPEESLRTERGRLWGDLFAFAPDAALADFALCEWTCASATELVRALPETKEKLARELVAVLVETDASAPRARLVSFRVGDIARPAMSGYPAEELRKRAGELAELVRKAILPDDDSIQRREEQCLVSRPSEGFVEYPLPFDDGYRPRLGAVDRFAALVRAEAEQMPDRRAACIAALAQAGARRLWDGDVQGGAWKREEFDSCPPCGMGRVGISARVFLQFYTAEKR
jgi:hypothetical protein